MLTASNQLRIIAFLKRFGCNRNESLAYVEVLGFGTTSLQELSRKLHRNRVSVYYSVQQLIENGLLFEIRKGKRRFIVAENPDILLRIIRERHAELQSLETDVDYISQLLNAIPTIRHETTIVKLYEETEGFKKMLEESLESKNEILIFSNTMVFTKILGEEQYEHYFIKKAARGISSRIIYPPCAFADKINAQKEQYKIDLRVYTQNQVSESGFYLWDNIVAIKSVKESKALCTIIENQDIAHFFRENIFNHFWKEAKPIESENGRGAGT